LADLARFASKIDERSAQLLSYLQTPHSLDELVDRRLLYPQGYDVPFVPCAERHTIAMHLDELLTQGQIQAQEDANVFAALDFAADTTKGGENTNQRLDLTDSTVSGKLSKNGMLSLKRQIDRWDLVTSKYFMNINEFTDILSWESAGSTGASQVDPVTQREILQTGLYGQIFGADIIVSKIVPAGKAFATAEPEFVGVMPVRQDIEVLPADEPKQLKLGWVVSEIVGIGIVNPRGVASGTIQGSESI
jgi:hypothetical protein